MSAVKAGKVAWTSHGHAAHNGGKQSPTYRVWTNMLTRCNNPKVASYRYYGARGVSVCERWSSFENFLADMGRRPSPKHSLDRKDNDGNYEPNNCRWATRIEQANNTSRNRHITIDEETKTLAEWLEIYSLLRETFYQRLRRGMSEQEALTTPKMRSGRKPRHALS